MVTQVKVVKVELVLEWKVAYIYRRVSRGEFAGKFVNGFERIRMQIWVQLCA